MNIYHTEKGEGDVAYFLPIATMMRSTTNHLPPSTSIVTTRLPRPFPGVMNSVLEQSSRWILDDASNILEIIMLGWYCFNIKQIMYISFVHLKVVKVWRLGVQGFLAMRHGLQYSIYRRKQNEFVVSLRIKNIFFFYLQTLSIWKINSC